MRMIDGGRNFLSWIFFVCSNDSLPSHLINLGDLKDLLDIFDRNLYDKNGTGCVFLKIINAKLILDPFSKIIRNGI